MHLSGKGNVPARVAGTLRGTKTMILPVCRTLTGNTAGVRGCYFG